MLVLERVFKSYGPLRVLAGVDLRLDAGEIVGLLGRNGAGKTTLMAVVAGLVRPDRGRVVVAGADVAADPRAAAANLGYTPQEIGVYPAASVRENLRLFGGLNGLRGARLRRAIADVADGMAIGELLDRRAGELSGGQQRRVHTAAALLHHAPVLLLDEPTAGADFVTRSAILETVRGRAAAGAAVLYTTHHLDELDRLGAAQAILEGGRIVAG